MQGSYWRYGPVQGILLCHFKTDEAAQQAIDKVNGMLLNDRKVFGKGELSQASFIFHVI